jgi:hypothetical protein
MKNTLNAPIYLKPAVFYIILAKMMAQFTIYFELKITILRDVVNSIL